MNRDNRVATVSRDAFTVVMKKKKRKQPIDKIMFVTVLCENKTQAIEAAKDIHPTWRIDTVERKHVIIHRSKA